MKAKLIKIMKLHKYSTIFSAAAVVLIILAAASVYLFTQYQKTQAEVRRLKEESRAEIVDETKKLLAEIGKHVELPTGEEPTVATITDREKLKGQAFFTRAENGDKVLIYTTAKKAILYRPGIDKVIETAPVNIGTSSATPSAQERTITTTPTQQRPTLPPISPFVPATESAQPVQ